jgi:osmotically-inducible protein OsmY
MKLFQPKIKNIFAILLVATQLQGCAAGVAAAALGGGYLVAYDRRSSGAMMDDQSVEVKTRHEIGKQIQEDEKSHITVVSYNNNVLLLGQVESQARKNSVEEAAQRVEKVRHVHNELQVAPPTSASQRAKDSWITTKIKSRMVADKELNSNRVKVITENGVVYLLGIVKSDEEEVSTDIARETKGVKKVVKMFEPMAT